MALGEEPQKSIKKRPWNAGEKSPTTEEPWYSPDDSFSLYICNSEARYSLQGVTEISPVFQDKNSTSSDPWLFAFIRRDGSWKTSVLYSTKEEAETDRASMVSTLSAEKLKRETRRRARTGQNVFPSGSPRLWEKAFDETTGPGMIVSEKAIGGEEIKEPEKEASPTSRFEPNGYWCSPTYPGEVTFFGGNDKHVWISAEQMKRALKEPKEEPKIVGQGGSGEPSTPKGDLYLTGKGFPFGAW